MSIAHEPHDARRTKHNDCCMRAQHRMGTAGFLHLLHACALLDNATAPTDADRIFAAEAARAPPTPGAPEQVRVCIAGAGFLSAMCRCRCRLQVCNQMKCSSRACKLLACQAIGLRVMISPFKTRDRPISGFLARVLLLLHTHTHTHTHT